MKYVIELRKNGVLRGEMIRADEKEAKAIVNEWNSRGCGNSADYHQEEKLWYAVYYNGELICVVSDERYDSLKNSDMVPGEGWEGTRGRDGKFYQTLREAIQAQLKEYGY